MGMQIILTNDNHTLLIKFAKVFALKIRNAQSSQLWTPKTANCWPSVSQPPTAIKKLRARRATIRPQTNLLIPFHLTSQRKTKSFKAFGLVLLWAKLTALGHG